LHGERISKLIGAKLTVFVRRPKEIGADWDWDIGVVRKARKDELSLANFGVRIDPKTTILASGYLSPVRNRQTVVVLRRDAYAQLPQDVKRALNLLWSRLETGRIFEKLLTKRTGLFLFTAADNRPELQAVEEELSRSLEEYGVGYVSCDEFELNLLRRMLDAEQRNAPITPDS
jgi:hypothetical protein